MAVPGKDTDFRRITLRRVRGRYSKRPDFYGKEGCKTVRSFKLTRPVFGGTTRKPLGIAYRLNTSARVTVTVTRGSKVVKRFAAATRARGKTFRLTLPLKGLRSGDYKVKLSAVAGGKTESSTLTSRKL